jgi:hypothetical protein
MKRSSAILMFETSRARNIEFLREITAEWLPLGTVRFEAHTGNLQYRIRRQFADDAGLNTTFGRLAEDSVKEILIWSDQYFNSRI